MDADLKLDFKDVLFRPKRSSLKSRSEVGVSHRDAWQQERVCSLQEVLEFSINRRVSLRCSGGCSWKRL